MLSGIAKALLVALLVGSTASLQLVPVSSEQTRGPSACASSGNARAPVQNLIKNALISEYSWEITLLQVQPESQFARKCN